jgi:hypothetical protein
MRKSSRIKTALSIMTIIFSVAIAMPIWGDTLILRDGTTRVGTLTGANLNDITFSEKRGRSMRYSVLDIQAIQFGDAPYRPNSGGGGPDRLRDDQSRMERVVLAAGTEVSVRTNERIDARNVVEGQSFSAQIEENVRDIDGSTAIPRGSDVRLVVRWLENNSDMILDIESITVEGQRYKVSTEDLELDNQRQEIGGNRRTDEFVGGRDILGAIFGSIAGGGKGAAIGTSVGTGTGVRMQIVTRGKEVRVPADSVIRFRLDRPLRLRLWS